MPKRIGNTQTSTQAGHSDILDIRSHKKLVAQDVYPDTANDVVRGVRFDGSSTLENDNSTQNNPNQYTISGWVKLNNVSSHYQYLFSGTSSNQSGVGGYWGILAHYGEAGKFGYAARHSFVGYSTNRYRDTSSWYHFVFVWEKSASKIKYYVNGQLSEEITGSNFGDHNSWMNGYKSRIGCRNEAWSSGSNAEFFKGYMADIYFVDGQALLPTDFGYYDTSTGQWKPKAYAGTYGTNGFYLPMRVGQYTQDETAKQLTFAGNSMVSGFKPQTNMEFGSFKFDGSGDTIYTANNYDDVNLIKLPSSGNKSWTLESWIYQTSSSGYQTIFSHGSSGSATSWQLQIYQSNIKFYWNNGNNWAWQYIYDTPVSINTWYHYALVYDHSVGTYGTLTAYINGTKVNLTNASGDGGTLQNGVLTLNSDGNFSSTITDQLFIASYYSHSSYPNWFSGYITDTRIVRGQALYTQNFAPPSQPLSKTYDHVNQQAITGTVALLLQPDAAGVDESGNNNDWTVTGMNKHDGVPDSPHNTFATFQAEYSVYHPTLSDGNTKSVTSTTANNGNCHQHIIGTMTFQQGKLYYFEVATPTTSADSQNFGIVGITKQLAVEYTSFSQNRSLFQNIPYPKVCFECRSAMVIDQTTIQDWGSSTFTDDTDINLALSNFTTDSDKFIRDGSQATSTNANRANTSQANTLANAAAGTPSGTGYIPSWTHSGNKIIGVLLNFTATDYGSISFTVDGTNWSTPFTKIKLNTGISWTLGAGGYAGDDWRLNCGQDPTFGGLVSSSGPYALANDIGKFYYDISSTDAVALCTQNLPTPEIENPEKYFNIVLYTGNGGTSGAGANSKDVTGLSFKPELVWIKGRTLTGYHHVLFDSVRGYNVLFSNNTKPENGTSGTEYNTGNLLSAFNNDGFTVNDAVNGSTNNSAQDYVAWCWRAGGAPSADGKAMVDGVEKTIAGDAVLDAGTFTPTRMSVNTKAGFSIILAPVGTKPGTIPHGLTKTPEFIIQKDIDNTNNWHVWTKSFLSESDPSAAYLHLHSTNRLDSFSASGYTVWGSAPTTQTIGIGHTSSTGSNTIVYAWHSVPGFSAIGTYRSNNSTDGPFVYTGFRPAWVMIKNAVSDATGNTPNYFSWTIYDNARQSHNPNHSPLFANKDAPEPYRGDGTTTTGGATEYLDFVSNGFKLRTNGSEINPTGTNTYIYMAFAEQSTNFTTAR